MTNKYGWTEYKPNKSYKEFAQHHYQKLITETVYADIYAYFTPAIYKNDERWTFELEIQLPEEMNITGQTLNIKAFTYTKLNFLQMEMDAKNIIDALRKKSLKIQNI